MSSFALQRLAAPGGAIADARVLGRLAVGFALDITAIVRGKRELIDSLLMATITQANTAAITRDAALQTTYAAGDAPPPDAMRAPVSIEYASDALRLPLEEARKRVRSLIRRKLCLIVEGGGVIVPTQALASPDYLKSSFEGYERLRAFYYELRDLGMLGDLPPPTVELSAELAPLRVVARLATDYILHVIEALMENLGGLTEGLTLLMVIRCNTEHMAPDVRGGPSARAEDFIADACRRPARVRTLARRLGLPQEAVRRAVEALLARGLLARRGLGLIAPAEALARPTFVACMAQNLINLQRMFAGLAQLGVLRAWDDLNPRASQLA